MSEPKSRSFVFTINNYTDDVVETLGKYGEKYCKYLVVGYEVGEQGTPHIQGYVEHKNGVSFSAFNKRLGLKKGSPYARCAPRKGTPKEAAGYCKKGSSEVDKNYDQFYDNADISWDGFEYGTISNQGQRVDIQNTVDEIMDGDVTPDDICINDAIHYHQYGRTFEKAHNIMKRKQFRTWMTEGVYYHGPTGVGKSHEVFKDFDPKTHYVWNIKEKLQTYKGQEIIIINDFRGEIDYAYMLNLIDKWPMYIPYKGEEPFPLLAKEVRITSSLPPEKVYKNRNEEDKLDQLLRRVKVIELKERRAPEGGTDSDDEWEYEHPLAEY